MWSLPGGKDTILFSDPTLPTLQRSRSPLLKFIELPTEKKAHPKDGELLSQEGDGSRPVSEAFSVLEDPERPAGLSPRNQTHRTQGQPAQLSSPQLPSESETANRPDGKVVKLAEDQAGVDSEDVRSESSLEVPENEVGSPHGGLASKGELPESG